MSRKSVLLNSIAIAGIVALVLAVVVPFLGLISTSPREGRKILTNMHMLLLALQVYSQDHDGYLPSSAIVSHSRHWKRADFRQFSTRLVSTRSGHGHSSPSWFGTLFPEYIKSERFAIVRDHYDKPPAPNAMADFWWKCAIDKAWYGDGCPKPYRRIADYPRQRNTIILYYRRASTVYGADDQDLRNGTRALVGCLDGCASSVTLRNATSGSPINCAANSNGEPMYFNYDNKTKSLCKGPASFVDPGRYSDRLQGLEE